MGNSYTISVIGAGNLAWSLSKNLEDTGHIVKEIYSLNLENAEELADQLYDAVPTDDPDLSGSEAQIFFIAIKDDALKTGMESFSFPTESLVVHCSGASGLDVFDPSLRNTGVFYPLQSFTLGQKTEFKNIPILIEANDFEGFEVLEDIAKSLSNRVIKCSEKQRKAIHLAAVFASNFTNHILGISQQILKEEGLDIEILHPLVNWTVTKAFELGPENSQTGPALRKDFDTIDDHLSLLSGHPELIELYENFTKQIMDLGDDLKSRDLKNP